MTTEANKIFDAALSIGKKMEIIIEIRNIQTQIKKMCLNNTEVVRNGGHQIASVNGRTSGVKLMGQVPRQRSVGSLICL